MTRLVSDGAEFGDLLFWSYVAGVGGLTASTSHPRSGAYSYHFNVNAQGYAYKTLPGTYGELFIRIAFRPESIFNDPSTFFRWYGNNGSELMGQLAVGKTTGRIYAYVGSTYVGVGTVPLSLDSYTVIEIRTKIDNSNGVLAVKTDGILDINYTGDTQPGSTTTIDQIRIKPPSDDGLNFGRGCFDDIAVNDTSGDEDNSWCGDGKIMRIGPNANGDSSDLLGSDGNSTDNYALVDEVPPSSTDYVEGVDSGETDLYNLAASGLENARIRRVWAEARGADTVAEGGEIYLPIKTNSVQYDGTSVQLLTSYTRQLKGDVYTLNPQTESEWTIEELDALQVGVKVV